MNYQQYRPTGFRILPPVIKNIIIINGLFFLATITFSKSLGIDLADILGLHFISADKFAPYQFLTYMFMHDTHGPWHILFNMFAVWMFGKVLEEIWGAKRFIIYYLVTGIGAALIHYAVVYYQMSPVLSAVNEYLQNPGLEEFKEFINSSNFQIVSYDIQNHFREFSLTFDRLVYSDPAKALQLSINFMELYKADFLNAPVVIGASGAVFGILLAFGMMFPNSLIYVYFAIPIKAKYFVMIYGAIELYSGISNNAGDNVAHFAHLGGMIFGFFLIKYWKKKSNGPYYYS